MTLLHSSCKRQSIINEAIKMCVELKTTEVFKDFYGENTQMDIYKMVSLVEAEFKNEGFLKNVTKEQYLQLLEFVYSNKESFSNNELIKEFSSISGLLITYVVIDCPYEIVVKERNELNSSIVLQLANTSELQASGYEKEAVINYIEEISESDFIHIEYRTPVIVILAFHLENTFRSMPDSANK